MNKFIHKWQWLWGILFMYCSGHLLYVKGQKLGFEGWDFMYEIGAMVMTYAVGYAFLLLHMQRNKLLDHKTPETE